MDNDLIGTGHQQIDLGGGAWILKYVFPMTRREPKVVLLPRREHHASAMFGDYLENELPLIIGFGGTDSIKNEQATFGLCHNLRRSNRSACWIENHTFHSDGVFPVQTSDEAGCD